jgi:hypothetical protein
MKMNGGCRTQQPANCSFLRCEPSWKDSKTKRVRSADTLSEHHHRRNEKTNERTTKCAWRR